jgi:microsomal epoxide hydrolase
MLANPVAHGAHATVAFDVVIPSLPGYCFSSAPKELGTNLFAIATQWAQLMSGLEYPRFIAQGGDFGAGVSTALGLRHADRLLGLHLNFIPGSYQPSVPEDRELSSEETSSLANRAEWFEREGGYAHLQRTKPDTLGPALNDSPIGLAAWIVDKFRSWSDCDGKIERRFSYDEILTTVSLYWFTRSMPSAMRLYWENLHQPLKLAAGERITVPVAIAHFPRELPIPARAYVERGYNVIRWSEMPRGGHFAALEEPELLAQDIRGFAGML